MRIYARIAICDTPEMLLKTEEADAFVGTITQKKFSRPNLRTGGRLKRESDFLG